MLRCVIDFPYLIVVHSASLVSDTHCIVIDDHTETEAGRSSKQFDYLLDSEGQIVLALG